MYCPNCGKRMEDGSYSCRECGAAFVMTTKKDHREAYRWLILMFAVLALFSTLLSLFTPPSAFDFYTSSLDSTLHVRPYSFNLWTFIFRGGLDEEILFFLIPAVVFCGAALTLFILMLIGSKIAGTTVVVLSSIMLAVSFGIVALLLYATNVYWADQLIGAGPMGMILCSLGAFIFSMLLKSAGKRRF